MDAANTPKAIDLTVIGGPEEGMTYHGIYKVEGDTYTICRNVAPDKERPTGFVTSPKSGLTLVQAAWR
jgi:uncharacterized protein (TIGR03067 family)